MQSMLLTLRHVLAELLRDCKQIDKSRKQQQKRSAKQLRKCKEWLNGEHVSTYEYVCKLTGPPPMCGYVCRHSCGQDNSATR